MNKKQFEIYAETARKRFEFNSKVSRVSGGVAVLMGGGYAYYLRSIGDTVPQNYAIAIPVILLGLFLIVAYRQGGFVERQVTKRLQFMKDFMDAGHNE